MHSIPLTVRYNGLDPEWYYLLLFAMLVGMLWFSIAIYLQYNRKRRYSRIYPLHFYLVGLGLLFIGNPVVVSIERNEPLSIFLAVIGFCCLIAAAVSYFAYLIITHPDTKLTDVFGALAYIALRR